jgi:hypothetical protein
MKKPNLNNFGKKLKLNERPTKQKTITEKDLFIETIDMFYEVWIRSNEAYEKYKINLLEYEEKFYQIIENCLCLKYSLWEAEIILWYIFAREDENNNVSPLLLQFDGKEDEEVIIKNSSDLWDLLERLRKENNTDK